MEPPRIMRQIIIRTSAILFVKSLGLTGKIFMTRTLGAEGLGFYQLVYSLYGLALMLLSGGLPTVLAMHTANYPDEGKQLLHKTSLMMMPVGLLGFLGLFLFSGPVASFLGYPQLAFPIKCISPALLVVPLLGLLRGYLQGREKFEIIAFSEIFEQGFRIGFFFLFIPLFIPYGIPRATGGALSGTFIGGLSALLLLGVFIQKLSFQSKSSVEKTLGTESIQLSVFLKMSLSIALTRLLIPASDFLDSMLIPKQLQAGGVSAIEAVKTLGIVSGIAVVVAYMPTLITGSLTHTLTMKISAAWRNREYLHFYKWSYRLIYTGWLWGLASSFFLFSFSNPIADWIFKVPQAGPSIKALSFLPLFVGLREISTSILWAKNNKRAPLMGLFWGCLANFLLLYLLVPDYRYIGIYLGILSLELLAVLYNFRKLKLLRQLKMKWIPVLWDILFFEGLTLLCGFLLDRDSQPDLLITLITLFLYLIPAFLYGHMRYKKLESFH